MDAEQGTAARDCRTSGSAYVEQRRTAKDAKQGSAPRDCGAAGIYETATTAEQVVGASYVTATMLGEC